MTERRDVESAAEADDDCSDVTSSAEADDDSSDVAASPSTGRSIGPDPSTRGGSLGSAGTYVGVAVATPVAYICYGLAVQQAQGVPFVPPRIGPRTVIATIAVAEFATLSVLAYRWGLRLGPGLTVGSLLAWPWVSAGVPFGGTDVLIPWVVTLYVGSVELARRRPGLLDDEHGRRALVVGAALFAFAVAVQTYTRPYLLAVTEGLWWIGALLVGVPAMGVVWLGVVAVLTWGRGGLVGPAVVVGGWIAWVVATFTSNLGRYPYTAFNGFGLFHDPAADVRASWVLAALGVVAVAGLERWYRRRRAASPAVETRAGD